MQCVDICPFNYYPELVYKKCQKCHVYCYQCTGPTNTECSACNGTIPAFLYQTTCGLTCPQYYFKDTANNRFYCSPCKFPCLTCYLTEN